VNQVELLQAELAVLSRRVAALEDLARAKVTNVKDQNQAQKIAQLIGFPVEILLLPQRISERKQLAKELRDRDWSFARIARVLNCSERSVWRWLEEVN
jgi:hypothetical protein